MKAKIITVLMAAFLVMTVFLAQSAAAGTKDIPVGGIFDLSGPTSALGKDYAQGVMDAVEYANRNGGVGGVHIRLLSRDYASEPLKAVSLFKNFRSVDKVFAIQGWGAADTSALKRLVNKNRIVFMSASYDGSLNKRSPYNFFIGSCYSDHIRMAMLYAKENGAGKVCFIYPNHPYGKNPIPAGKEFAKRLGLEIGPDIFVGLRATDAAPQLLRLKEFDPDFAWVGGTTPSVTVILKDAAKIGLRTKFLINTWGIDEYLSKLAGVAAEGRAFGFIVVRPFGFNVPETDKIKSIAGNINHTLHYNKAWASMMVMWEGLKRANTAERLNGPGLKAALETLKDFGTGGLTPPLTYTKNDHRATTQCGLYTIKGGKLTLVTDVTIEREKNYLGW